MYIMTMIAFEGFILTTTSPHSSWDQVPSPSPSVRDEMASHSRSSYATWLALFVSSFGSTACAYVTVIPATTFAQPSFVYEEPLLAFPSYQVQQC